MAALVGRASPVESVKPKVQDATDDEIRSWKDGRLVQTWKPACTDLHNSSASIY